jgi:hypothetical protein
VNDGLCSVLSTMPSFSKSQAQEVGELVERSVNCTASGASPEVTFAVKSATEPQLNVMLSY